MLGVPLVSYLIYTMIALPWFLLNHSNMKYPAWFERWGSWLMSTPNWHRVHHSRHQPETDSHYGCVLSVWDRLFGTTRKTNVESIQFGLDRFPGIQPADRLGAPANAVQGVVTRAGGSPRSISLSHLRPSPAFPLKAALAAILRE